MAENKYAFIRNFCLFNAIKVHCKRLVIKNKGRDKSKILKGSTAGTKSFFINVKKGEINQKGIIKIIPIKLNIKKYCLTRIKNFRKFFLFFNRKG